MSVKKYDVFLRVVELGSLTKAAEALGYTQSGVSHIIGSLEKELGFPLLLRGRSGTRLTDGGRRILPCIRGMLNYAEQLEQVVSAIRGLDAGTVRVGAFTSVAVRWLPGMLKQFLEDYPRIEFKLLNGDYHNVERWLTEGSIDLGFVSMPCAPEGEYIPLRKERLLAILPPEHRLAGLARLPIGELEGEPFISLERDTDHDARRALESSGVRPKLRFSTRDDYAIIAMVEQGLGVSIMPELLLEGRRDRVRILELDPPSSRTIALAIPAAAHVGPAARKFADYVKNWVADRYGKVEMVN
jgi:DNA-binding transcriptional LysR family regulator